jgi:hypothetical protein
MAAIERHDAELHAVAAKQAGAGRHIAWGRNGLHCRPTYSFASPLSPTRRAPDGIGRFALQPFGVPFLGDDSTTGHAIRAR